MRDAILIRGLVLAFTLFGLAGCKEEPARKPLPGQHGGHAGEDRRSHAVSVPGPVGSIEGARYFIDLQADRPEAVEKRPVLVESDARARSIGHAYLSGRPNKGFVDLDVVVIASNDTVWCYDASRHELRWEVSYADRGFDVDELVRRGTKLDVIFAGKQSETLGLATGQKTVP